MEDKQKVTLYLSPELHRQLKIRAAVDGEPMSALAQKALMFYLAHPEVVEEIHAVSGNAHRIYSCPACETKTVLRNGDLVAVSERQDIVVDEDISVEKVNASIEQQSEEGLVTC
ncbi:MAG: hypothetical protein J7641_13865 [Cyanobacteria bacterium SID2]|nr:hypothetical protein [Cyanobacteria bacterium SID2]MBP0002812.1 hypothetical protein [Cyanobacteria bacterium SBC]